MMVRGGLVIVMVAVKCFLKAIGMIVGRDVLMPLAKM